MKKIDIRQGTPEWLEYRKNKRNASEIGNVLGVGFQRPEMFARTKFLEKPTYTTAAMRDGLEYESVIRDQLNAKYNAHMIPQTCLTDDGVYSASLDGVDWDLGLYCEIKFSRTEYLHLLVNEKPTEKYYAQMQQQMFVTGFSEGIFAAGYIADNFEVIVKSVIVKRDDEYIEKIKKAWDDFYEKFADIIDRDVADATDVVTDDFLDLKELVNRTNSLHRKIELLNAELDECKQKLIDYAKGEDIKVENITITKVTRKPTYDYKAYCESIKAVIGDEFRKEGSTSWAVRINKIK